MWILYRLLSHLVVSNFALFYLYRLFRLFIFLSMVFDLIHCGQNLWAVSWLFQTCWDYLWSSAWSKFQMFHLHMKDKFQIRYVNTLLICVTLRGKFKSVNESWKWSEVAECLPFYSEIFRSLFSIVNILNTFMYSTILAKPFYCVLIMHQTVMVKTEQEK